ncbi:MAG TPA: DUF6089 family protein [Bacteroidia bacterium]|nr:DUF6089 family protein [Bacteroidia bacterium]HNS13238.1 DUF6089 family protein [Bacteroidia bacterium]
MLKKVLLFSLLFICLQNIFAQEQRGMIGFGLSGGASNYAGDLDDNFTLPFTRLGFGAHAIFLFRPRLFLRVALFHGQITASDGHGVNFSGNQYRNLSFYSEINEGGIHVMYSLQSRKRGFTRRNIIAPYIFAGIAYFQFNPKRSVNGQVYELQKVGTEGQYLPGNYPKPYSLHGFSIPFGLGFSLKLSKNFDFGIESGMRKTYTDYLDDVSTVYPDKLQMTETSGPIAAYLADPSNDPDKPLGKPAFSKRGNPGNKDWYVYTNVHITYYITTSLFKPPKIKSRFKNNTCKGLNGR